MDFSFSTVAQDAATLTAQVAAAELTDERRRAVAASGGFDADLWKALSQTGLLDLTAPTDAGGAGLSLIDATRVVLELGRITAPVPAAGHIAATTLLAENAHSIQGTTLIAVALAESHDIAPDQPHSSAVRQGDTWVLNGVKVAITGGLDADTFLVSASTPEGTGLFLIPASTAGITITSAPRTGDERSAHLDLRQVTVDETALIGAPDGATARRLADLATVLWAAEQLGVCEGALALTASYASQREQFGRPIGTFQAVSQRLADAYIDVLGARLTLWRTVWRLSEHLPSEIELASTALWAADTGHQLAHTTVHIHGGMGIDLDGSAHRYFSAATRLQYTLGGTTAAALRVGRALAAPSSAP